MIEIKRAAEQGTVGLQCGPDVKCKDCGFGMEGLMWYAERLIGMVHDQPEVELICLRCARKAKMKLTEGKV